MMTDDEIIAVVQAHKEGKQIQVLEIHSGLGWVNVSENKPNWNFGGTNYRVAPEPRKPREWWVIKRDNGSSFNEFVAYECKQSYCDKEQIHVREVIE